MSGEELPSVLKVISNRVRRNTIQVLNEEKLTYLELLISCGLSPDRHCGWFDYHLGVLLDEGVVTKEENQYLLTDFGKGIARLLTTIEGESHKLFQKEVTTLKKEEVVVIQEEAPSITIEEIPAGKLTINLDHRQSCWWQGERRIYRELDVPGVEDLAHGKNSYHTHSCLERLCFPKKEEYHYVTLYEVYSLKYDGTEENRRIVERTEGGYFLDNWFKAWEVQKHDGLYETKRISWNVRGSTEIEEEVSDPPEKLLTLPLTLRIGDKFTKKDKIVIKGEERGEIISNEQIVGEYKVRIGEIEHHCLLSRSIVTTNFQSSKDTKSWKRIVETFKGKDSVVVLNRRYDAAQWLKRHEIKNWENSPKIEYDGETYYLLPSESYYLAERYIPIVNLGRTEDP